MASGDILASNLDSSTRYKSRWSEPQQRLSQWDSSTLAHLTMGIPRSHSSFIPLGHTTNEHLEDSSSNASDAESNITQSGERKPSILRLRPLAGLMALSLGILQICASYAILRRSDGRAVLDWKAHWRLKPAVYLAILTAVSNTAITFALAQGAVITFWLRPLHTTTLGQLHRDWAFGSQVHSALSAGKNISLLAVACIFATLVIVDGPLLQRASSIQIASNRPIELTVSIAPEVPSYFSGFYNYNATEGVDSDFSDAMMTVVRGYTSNAPITGGIQGCTGTCAAIVQAPALIVHHCESNITWRNFSAPWTKDELKVFKTLDKYPKTREIYEVSLSSIEGTAETLDFYTYLSGHEVAKTCAGPVNSTHCYLRSAIAEYDVLVVDDVITLTDPANPSLVSWANNTAITESTISKFDLHRNTHPKMTKTTLGGIVDAFQFQFAFSGWVNPPKRPDVLNVMMEPQSLFMIQHAKNFKQVTNDRACTFTWEDPRPAAMAGMNELMFRIGVYATNNYNNTSLKPLLDSDLKTQYNVTGSLQSPIKIFRSDFKFYYAAAAIEAFTIALVASTFFGYWRLDRDVSFSPLEIAKAFNAPLLDGLASNMSGKDFASHTHAQQVQYSVKADRRISRLNGVSSGGGDLVKA